MPFSVLVSSISKKVPLLQSVRNAMSELNLGELYGCDMNKEVVGGYFVDCFWKTPSIDDLNINDLAEFCDEFSIRAIIPTRDGELSFFAKHAKSLDSINIATMVSPADCIEICSDKLAFAHFLERHHFPFIPTAHSLNDIEGDRLVVKNQVGSGASSMYLGVSRKDVKKILKPGKVVQPYITGSEYSVDLYRTLSGTVHGCVVRRRNLVIHGESQITTTLSHPMLESLCSDIANALGIYGHAVFQAIEDSGGNHHIVECNPRFGGASTASVAVGLNSFKWFFQEALKKKISPFERGPDVRQIRYPCDAIDLLSETE